MMLQVPGHGPKKVLQVVASAQLTQKSADILENPKNKDVLDAVQGLSKRGMDLTYLGNGSSVLAVAGQCSQGGNIVIWDSHRPLTSGPVARLSYHMAAVTALKVAPSAFKLFPSNFSLQALPCKLFRTMPFGVCRQGGSLVKPMQPGAYTADLVHVAFVKLCCNKLTSGFRMNAGREDHYLLSVAALILRSKSIRVGAPAVHAFDCIIIITMPNQPFNCSHVRPGQPNTTMSSPMGSPILELDSAWLLIRLTPKGVVLCFLFSHVRHGEVCM